eukprot:CAMPEP_0114363724 /NCGR_PEP_ID=MMETSP0101-20121206/26832_1 /TAXON_ID=38822 ORGANISM="Pteridomonas danica, Strain PT" /NCGR_SAMPLE_ID=MMETSP0101 /ASSEMBLY_ACC=CAM_ASM_000211 /LENGTH=263 /DNA_ID=CAMNT_0001510611 /DNA_START=272 /DNA_END=1063 /DNA_ORIENTATION=+
MTHKREFNALKILYLMKSRKIKTIRRKFDDKGTEGKGSDSLEERLNLCGLLVDQREDFDVPCANNKVDEYHTSVAHFRAWKDRLALMAQEEGGRQVKVDEEDEEGEEEEEVGLLEGLLSPIDALCEDPIIAGALKQFGISFEGEPPTPPASRVDELRQSTNSFSLSSPNDKIKPNETGGSGDQSAEGEEQGTAEEQEAVRKMCEDFGRLFASCNVKCGVPSVMISRDDFGEVLRNVRKELNKQQAFSSAASMLRVFRIKNFIT